MEDTSSMGPRTAPDVGLIGRWLFLAVALAAVGCSNYVGTTAASYLRRIREDPDPNLRYIAYGKLAQPNCYADAHQRDEAVKILVAKLEQGKEPLATRAMIISTLGSLRDPAARDVIVKAVNDPEPVLRVQACRALGKVGKTEDATVLTRVMSIDTLEDCRIAAIEALGDLKPDDIRIKRMLVTGMKHEDPATRLASLKALRKITGKDLGVDVLAWEKSLQSAESETKTSIASSSPLSSPATTPATPSYPPRPPVPSSIAAATATGARFGINPDAVPASFDAGPAPKQASQVSPASYPPHNPNLPPAPRP